MKAEIYHFIISADQVTWYYLNSVWHNQVFDAVLPFFRNQWFWTPVYFFLLLFMPSRFGKNGWWWCLLFLSAFIISDQVSAGLLKPLFHRLRPCKNPVLLQYVHLLVPCGGQYGFPSSHASNHFAIGVYAIITTKKFFRWIQPLVLVWAVLVCYAQVYVGVHYPLDVTFGALLGTIIGYITGVFYNSRFGLESSTINKHEMAKAEMPDLVS